jgi:hypothetical protein
MFERSGFVFTYRLVVERPLRARSHRHVIPLRFTQPEGSVAVAAMVAFGDRWQAP